MPFLFFYVCVRACVYVCVYVCVCVFDWMIRWVALHRGATAYGDQTNTGGLRLQNGSDSDAHRSRQHAPSQTIRQIEPNGTK